jgi:hypothetical protein
VLEISVVSKLLALTEEEIITLVLLSKSFSRNDIDKVNKISGMDISLTTAKTDKETKSY